MNGSGRTKAQGFTLIEMMVVVAIIGILAAVAVPIFRGYLLRSKASETSTVLEAIRLAEVAYFNEYHNYTGKLDWLPILNGSCNDGETHYWDFALRPEWLALAFEPGGPTWYCYQVVTSCNPDGTSSGAVLPANVGTAWPPAGELSGWFVVTAKGDIDGNGQPTEFYISSHNNTVFHRDQGEEY